MPEDPQSPFVGSSAAARLLAVAVIQASIALISGCSSDPAPLPDEPRDFSTLKIDQVKPAGEGLDVEFWVIDLSPAAIGRALDDIQGAELTDAQARLWRSNGLRIFKTTAKIAGDIGASLPLHGQARRDSLPLLPRWSSLASGRAWTAGVEIWLDQQNWTSDLGTPTPTVSTGHIQLGAGSLRVLARTWPIAVPPDLTQVAAGPATLPAALVVQLMPQHVDSIRSSDDRLTTTPQPSLATPQKEGQAFDRLMLEVPCMPGEAIIIVPAHPRESWHALADPNASSLTSPQTPSTRNEAPLIEPQPLDDRDHAETGDPSADPDAPAAPARGSRIGPSVPDLLSLGEAMLTDAIVGNAASRRVIVVITPRVPASFDPLPTPRL